MSRFHHSGPAILFAVDIAPTVLVNGAADPAIWSGGLIPLGTCERYPQMATQVIREDVRNDLGGDNVIFKTSHGHKMTLQAELNRWSQATLDAIISTASGGAGTRQGIHDAVLMATPTDILGNSTGLFVWYPDNVNRNEVGYIIPLAVLMETSPTKVGNRTSSVTVKFESNTGFSVGSILWYSYDYLKFQNNDAKAAAIDTACKAAMNLLGGFSDNGTKATGGETLFKSRQAAAPLSPSATGTGGNVAPAVAPAGTP